MVWNFPFNILIDLVDKLEDTDENTNIQKHIENDEQATKEQQDHKEPVEGLPPFDPSLASSSEVQNEDQAQETQVEKNSDAIEKSSKQNVEKGDPDQLPSKPKIPGDPFEKFKIGEFRLKDNEENNFTERELKSIDVDSEAKYFKITCLQNYNNKLNVFNQISIINISCFGNILGYEDEYITGLRNINPSEAILMGSVLKKTPLKAREILQRNLKAKKQSTPGKKAS